MKIFQNIATIIFLFLGMNYANGQTLEMADSLIKTSKTQPSQVHIKSSLLLQNKSIAPIIRSKLLEANIISAYMLNKFDSVIIKSIELTNIYKELGDSLGIASAANKAALAHYAIGDYEKSLENHLTALAINKKFDETKLSHTHINLGILYKDINQLIDAKYHQKQAIFIAQKNKDLKVESYAFNNLAAIYRKEKHYDSAMLYYQKSLKIKRETKDSAGEMNSLGNIGKLFLEQNMNDSAYIYISKTQEIANRINNIIGIITTNLEMAQYYKTQKDYNNAEHELLAGLKKAKEISYKTLEINFQEDLASLYEQRKSYDKAYGHLKQYVELFEDINEESKNKSLQKLQIIYKTKEHEQQHKLLQKENTINKLKLQKQKSVITDTILLAAAIILILSIVFIQKHRHNKFLVSNNEILERRIEERTKSLSNEIKQKEETSKQLLNALNEAKKAKEIKNAFLRNISHEIRTPLNAIVGFSGLLITQPKDVKLSEDIAEIINSNNEALLKIINNLIDLANIDTDQFTLYKKRISTNEISTQIKEDLTKTSLKNKKNHIQTSFTNNNPDTIVKTDLFRLKQIVYNLLENAFKFTKEGFVHVTLSVDEYISITITDSGLGIDDKKQKILFKRYNELSDSSTNEGGGFGLSISKAITHKMGGELTLIKTSPQGSSFLLQIPKA